MKYFHNYYTDSKIYCTNEETIMIIPNCPNNKEIAGKDERSGHFELLLVFLKPESVKVTDVNGTLLFTTVKILGNLNHRIKNHIIRIGKDFQVHLVQPSHCY